MFQVDKPATFGVNLNGVRGSLAGRVFAPSGNEEEMFIEDMDKDLYSCRFIPKENGVYYVHIRFNNVHIPGSPFPMLVGKLGADPALVLVSGKGLERGVAGQCKDCLVFLGNSIQIKIYKTKYLRNNSDPIERFAYFL